MTGVNRVWIESFAVIIPKIPHIDPVVGLGAIQQLIDLPVRMIVTFVGVHFVGQLHRVGSVEWILLGITRLHKKNKLTEIALLLSVDINEKFTQQVQQEPNHPTP